MWYCQLTGLGIPGWQIVLVFGCRLVLIALLLDVDLVVLWARDEGLRVLGRSFILCSSLWFVVPRDIGSTADRQWCWSLSRLRVAKGV